MARTFLILLLLLGGCAGAEFTPAPGAGSYPTHEGEVRILSEFPAEGSYERLGILIASGVKLTSKEELIENLTAEAARRGADAIVLQGDVKILRGMGGGSIKKKLGAFALKTKP